MRIIQQKDVEFAILPEIERYLRVFLVVALGVMRDNRGYFTVFIDSAEKINVLRQFCRPDLVRKSVQLAVPLEAPIAF